MLARLQFSNKQPFTNFLAWYSEAKQVGEHNPHAAVLSTCSQALRPSSRVVFVQIDEQQNIFDIYTHLNSRKGQEIIANPSVSLCFYWQKLEKQVRIEGTATIISNKKADEYFAARDRGKQINAWSSYQSEILDENIFEQRIQFYEQKFANQSVPRPDHWSGFSIIPHYYEFWTSGKDRFHQRDSFLLEADVWHHYKLQP